MNVDFTTLTFLLFILGLFIGSFLNVLADRLPKDENVITGRSHCDHCNHSLFFLDLIPVLSFIFLRGKCRYCHGALSWYYPFSELLTGILFAITFFVFTNTSIVNIFFSLFIVSCFIVIFSSDLKYGIIPDKIIFPALVVCILFRYFAYEPGISGYLFSALGAGSFFLLLFLFTRGRGMGFGDVKLALLMGLVLGFPGIIYALYIGFLTGASVSLILILWKKKHLKSTIPFGPFLVFGTLSVYLFPEVIEQVVKMVLPY